MQLQVKACQ